eukprot:1870061-Alexandrium_andersonii.AAC.1
MPQGRLLAAAPGSSCRQWALHTRCRSNWRGLLMHEPRPRNWRALARQSSCPRAGAGRRRPVGTGGETR